MGIDSPMVMATQVRVIMTMRRMMVTVMTITTNTISMSRDLRFGWFMSAWIWGRPAVEGRCFAVGFGVGDLGWQWGGMRMRNKGPVVTMLCFLDAGRLEGFSG